MAYGSKEQDREKRRLQEGSYSLYNHMYRWLMDNYEPEQLRGGDAAVSAEKLLVAEGLDYSLKGGEPASRKELAAAAREAVRAFVSNSGEHGDTARNLGKRQENSFDTIKSAVSDLRW